MTKKSYTVELKLCVRHEAEARLRQAYARLSQPVVEVQEPAVLAMRKENQDATSRSLCPGVDPEPGKGSHD